MTKKKKLVVANWKMNPASLADAKKIYNSTKKSAALLKNAEVVVCPPAIYISTFAKGKASKNVSLGAQNISADEKGAFTGETSIGMIKDMGVKYSIIGHSERRKMGETNQDVKRKIESAFNQKITPIVCIGEWKRDPEGEYLNFIRSQIKECFDGLRKSDLVGLIIAYEPVWAIGKSYKEAMNPTDIHEKVLYIKKYFGELLGQDIASSVKILYGGSVEAENAYEVIKIGNVDGFLVGHASLVPATFADILKAADIK
jgi:triosephosphate isomerase